MEDYAIMLREFFTKLNTHLIHIGLAAAIGNEFYSKQIERIDNAIIVFQQNAQLFQQIIEVI